MKKLAAAARAGARPGASATGGAVSAAARRFDAVNGGMQGAPKFPSSFPVRLLLRHGRRAGDALSLRMAVKTLDAMRAGGIRDQLGGGFHRYATDAGWRVPHFEKMLYDNALLAVAYLEAAQATGEGRFAETARETLDYMLRELRGAEGVFFSATDADSLAPSGKREEGWFFTWTPAEMAAVLEGDAEVAAPAFFGVTSAGQVDGRSVLASARTAAEVGSELGWEAARVERAVEEARRAMLAARAKRAAPLRDEKAIVAWNALAVSALARAAIVLGEARYAEAATKAAGVLAAEVRADRALPHAYVGGKGVGRGFVDDHAALALALMDVFELTAEAAWLRDAVRLMERVESGFADGVNGGYFLTAEGAEALILRDKPADDGPIPSGNSMAAMAWARLAVLTGEDRYRARAETTLRAFATPLERRAGALEAMLWAVDFATDAAKEIVIVVPDAASGATAGAGGATAGGATAGAGGATGAMRAGARGMLGVLGRTFVPSSVLVVATEAELAGEVGKVAPWTREKIAKGGRVTAYVCERGACKLPVTEPEELAKVLAEVKAY
ncbi:MAG: hypothetical protein R3B70_22145 [Polyangiaceae bacterium]